MTNNNANTNKDNDSQNTTKKSFESAYAELESIVKRMEAGDQGLEESLTDFEQGIQLIKQCHTHLQNAEQRIQLVSKNNDGEITSKSFDEES